MPAEPRALPYNLDAERSFIGSVVLDPAALGAADGLEGSDFFGSRERKLFEAALALRDAGKDINPTTLAEVSGEDPGTIGDYVEGIPRPSHARSYVEIIQDKAARRKLIRACEAARDGAFNGRSLDDLLSALGPQLTMSDGRGAKPMLMEEIAEDPTFLEAPEVGVPRFGYCGRVTLFAAREKLGKTTTAKAQAAVKSTGGVFLGERVEPGTVLWVGLEEHLADTVRGLEDFEACRTRIWIMDRVVEPLSDLEAAVHQVEPDLVFVDTLAALTEGMELEPGDASAWTPVMSRISRIARDTGAAIVLLHHGAKDGGRYRDSTAIGAGVDLILEMYEGEDPQVRKVRARGRWRVEDFSIRLVDSKPPRFDLAGGEVTMDARILIYLQANPGASKREVRKGVTGRASEIDSTLARLEERGAVEDRGSGGASSFHIAQDTPESPGRARTRAGHGSDTLSDDGGAKVCPEEGGGT